MEPTTLNSIVSNMSQKIKDLVAVYDHVRNLWIMEHGISGTLVVGHTCVQGPAKMLNVPTLKREIMRVGKW
jgi:hypothetical protein